MPTYSYRCRKCEHQFDLFHSIKDDRPKRCPKCRSRADRVPVAGAGVLFKGSGFYITDYRSSSYRERAKQEGSSAGDGGSASKSGESGGAAKSDSTGTSKSTGSGASESSAPKSTGGKSRGTKSEGGGRKRSGSRD